MRGNGRGGWRRTTFFLPLRKKRSALEFKNKTPHKLANSEAAQLTGSQDAWRPQLCLERLQSSQASPALGPGHPGRLPGPATCEAEGCCSKWASPFRENVSFDKQEYSSRKTPEQEVSSNSHCKRSKARPYSLGDTHISARAGFSTAALLLNKHTRQLHRSQQILRSSPVKKG